MRVLIAASIVAFGLTTTAHADLRYYIDQDVLRNNDAPTLLHRAMRDIGRNPTGWSHQWCGRQMVMWVVKDQILRVNGRNTGGPRPRSQAPLG